MRKSFDYQKLVTDAAQSAFSDRYRLISSSFEDSDNVWLAEVLPDGSRHVVVKKVPRRFAEELAILQSLDHPNIVRVLEVLGADDCFYVVMEHCEGGELFSIILQEGGLAESDCRNIVRQIASALAYLHARELSHGDIKPENICCLTESLEIVKLIDFGSAGASVQHAKIFTKQYAAPEILSASEEDRLDLASADMWSLGTVLHAMVYGSIDGVSISQSCAPDSVDNLILSLLVYEPSNRLSAKKSFPIRGQLPSRIIPCADSQLLTWTVFPRIPPRPRFLEL